GASPAILARVGHAPSLSALGLDAAAAEAIETGAATGTARIGDVSSEALVERLGDAGAHVLVVTWGPHLPVETAVAQPAPMIAEHPDPERRHPLRFVWQMDADGRFAVGSDEFIELIGPRTMASFGRKWSDVAAELKLDPEGQVARAVATRETWSGIVVSWPADEANDRLPIELSGLPVFDRDRGYRGYRGF